MTDPSAVEREPAPVKVRRYMAEGPLTRSDWAERIRCHLRRTVEAIVAAGRDLIEAKAALPHGEWLPLLEEIGIQRSTAHKLMAVARHPELSNVDHGPHLPSSWRTLYELSRLPPEQIRGAIEAGEVRPDMQRNDAIRLARGVSQPRQAPPLPDRGYPVLYADPPWRYDVSPGASREVENHYPTMMVEDIAALDVPAGDDAVLFMWATNPKLEDAISVLRGWGFRYVTNMVWVKDRIGMGYYARQRHELLLIGRRGSMRTPQSSLRPDSVIEAPRRQHSAKPAEVYGLIEAMYPALPKLELFARARRDGWDAWGNEVAAPTTLRRNSLQDSSDREVTR